MPVLSLAQQEGDEKGLSNLFYFLRINRMDANDNENRTIDIIRCH